MYTYIHSLPSQFESFSDFWVESRLDVLSQITPDFACAFFWIGMPACFFLVPDFIILGCSTLINENKNPPSLIETLSSPFAVAR